EANAGVEDALNLADRALRAGPGNPEVHRLRGDVLLLKKQPAEAAAELEKAISIGAGDLLPAASMSLGEAYIALGRIDDARRVFDRTPLNIAHSPPVPLLMNMGRLLANARRADLALTYFTRASEIAPDDPSTHLAVAAAAAGIGDWPRAAAAYRRAQALFARTGRDAPEVALGLAKALLEMGKADDAAAVLKSSDLTASFPADA